MKSFARITIALAVLLLALPTAGRADGGGSAARWRVMELPGTGSWFEGRMSDQPGSVPGHQRGSALGRGSAFGNGHYSIYLLNLTPGADYTLGLRYPADSRTRLAVTLFDRWPGDPQAKRYQLSTGPVVLTNPDRIEYRWRIGVSGRSRGNLAFAVVQAAPGIAGANGRFRHFMYLTTPAIQPKNRIGTGITYLRGPSDLFLPQQTGVVEYVIEYPYSARDYNTRGGDHRGNKGDLIRNGDFRRDVREWDVFSDGSDPAAGDHVAFGDDGVRIWSGKEPVPSGVRQTIRRDVQHAESLILGMELRIDRDSDASVHTDAAALELTVCYLDSEGKNYCGADAYRVKFTTHRVGRGAKETIRVNKGEWFPFQDELMDLDPRPQVVKSVAIAGASGPRQDVWIRQVHLIERGN
ncbi:MAG TPA: hypothetical protein ENH32_01145 [Proteobacteria bacterium]|nr:hypothetical protein BMS3Abin14_00179 [bacterium BMS3Abin14]HDL52559.1 hypothetical protein [Pseudomonadota bacterium]